MQDAIFFAEVDRKKYNNFNPKRRVVMSKKRKNKEKVIKLTDEEYNAYIMALKDEKPPKLVRDTQ